MASTSYKSIPTDKMEKREEKEEKEEEETDEEEAQKKKFQHGSEGEESTKAPQTASALSSSSSPTSSCWRRVPSAFSGVARGATPVPALPIAMPSGAVLNSVLRMTFLFPQMLRSYHRDELDLGDCRSKKGKESFWP